MPPGRSTCTRRGVTLLEVVLAMGLLVVLTSMTYWFYSSILDTRRRGTLEAQNLRLVRVVLSRIAREIEQASAITTDNGVGIRGEPERIWLSTLRVPDKELAQRRSSRKEPPPGQYDMMKVEYRIVRHPDIVHEDGYEEALGLARVEILVPRADTAQTGEAFEDEERIVGAGAEADAMMEAALEEALFGDEEVDDGPELGDDIEWEELYSKEIR